MQEENRENEKASEQEPLSPEKTGEDSAPDVIKAEIPYAEDLETKEKAAALAPEKPESDSNLPLNKPLAMRHVVFRASSNSFYLTITMFTVVLLYGICVVFLVPVEWLKEQDWQVFKSIKALSYLMMTTLLTFPIALLFQLLIAGMVREFKRCKWQMEMGGLAAGLLLCILFFWPGWFL